MNTINSGGKPLAGFVMVCGKEVYVDVRTGTGFCEVFDLMKDIIGSLARKYGPTNGWKSVEDARQDVCVAMLEGMARYDAMRGAALSTFLYKFVSDRMIDRLRKRVHKTMEIDLDMHASMEMAIDERLDLTMRTGMWDDQWQEIMVRLFVNGDRVMDVAADKQMSPWGLSRAVRRKLAEARKA
jgi:DNA-directed RNA polymerase specialized sigma subunit